MTTHCPRTVEGTSSGLGSGHLSCTLRVPVLHSPSSSVSGSILSLEYKRPRNGPDGQFCKTDTRRSSRLWTGLRTYESRFSVGSIVHDPYMQSDRVQYSFGCSYESTRKTTFGSPTLLLDLLSTIRPNYSRQDGV